MTICKIILCTRLVVHTLLVFLQINYLAVQRGESERVRDIKKLFESHMQRRMMVQQVEKFETKPFVTSTEIMIVERGEREKLQDTSFARL